MPLSQADGKLRVVASATPWTSMDQPTITELNAAKMISCRLLKGSYAINPGDSNTIEMGNECQKQIPKVPTTGTWADTTLVVFRYFNATGMAETAVEDTADGIGDDVFQMFKTKGTVLYLADRLTSKDSTDQFAVGEEIRTFQIRTDTVRRAERDGWIRYEIPIFVVDGDTQATVKAAA